MHYVVHCIDRPGAVPDRLHHYEAHKAYLATAPARILVSGPLLAEDGVTMVGSFFLIEADDRGRVEAFNRNDPFRTAGIWAEVRIDRFLKRVDNRGQDRPARSGVGRATG